MTVRSDGAKRGFNAGMLRQRRLAGRAGRAAIVGVAAAALIAGGLLWAGAAAGHAKVPGWQPQTIDNLVLEAGPGAIAVGHGYSQIATRAEDPPPLSVPELARVFPPDSGGRVMGLSSNCAAAVTGRAVKQALASGGCSQVLRLIATSTGTGGPYRGLIDIFNLASGAAVYQAARAFGEESPYSDSAALVPRPPPNAAPGGFIRPWPGTPAANIAHAAGNAADIDAFGHFLVVLWTYGSGGATVDDSGPRLANGLFELRLGQFAENRVGRDSAG